MLISDIVPYARNARNNERAIPAVADSIREFGLRGTIGLESRENPVIVFGHTRVEACKSLGWTEIPDEKIEFCDDLTPEQVKAFRIADNKTGDIATYNKLHSASELAAGDAMMKARKEENYRDIADAELHPGRGPAGIPARRLLHRDRKRR